MDIHLVFVTYNRLHYSKLALSSVLGDPTEEFSLTIWDNASTDGTVEYLKNKVTDHRIVDIVFSKDNIGQTAAVNEIWSKSKADLFGKLDNDCLMTPGWTKTLVRAYEDIDGLGLIGCWRFPLEDFDENSVRKAGKIQTFGKHQILRHPWTCGSGMLIRRETFNEFGPIRAGTTTKYQLQIALSGYINGYYYPLILQEHMDDLKSKHCLLKDDESIRKYREVTVVLREHNVRTMKDRWARRRLVLRNLNCGPWDVKYYVGWRGKIRNLRERIHNIIRM